MEIQITHFKGCLSEGFYKFGIFDSYGDGVNGDSGHSTRVNDLILKEGSGSDGFQSSEKHKFIVTRPSSSLSAQPSLKPSPSNFQSASNSLSA